MFKPTHIVSFKFLYIPFIYLCISYILTLFLYSPRVYIENDVDIELFYFISMILSNYCLYHVNVTTIFLHAYYKHTKVFWTGSKVEQIGYTLYKHICNEI